MFGSPIIPQNIHQTGVGQVSYAEDDRMLVWFFRKSIQNGAQSEAEGRPIFEGKDYVHIQQPGERDYIEREAHQGDIGRWPRHWQAYQEGREQDQAGTPIATLYPTNPEVVDMMRALKVSTVEQLANLTEQGIARMGMGARAHVQRAKDFLEAAKGMAHAHALQRQIEERDDRIATLEQRLAALEAAAEKRGRKAKDDE